MREIYSLAVVEARNPDCSKVTLPPKPLGEDPSCLSQHLVALGVPQPVTASLHSLPHLLFPSLIKTLVIVFRAHPESTGVSLKVFNCICRDPFPNKITFTGFRRSNLDLPSGGPAQPTITLKEIY